MSAVLLDTNVFSYVLKKHPLAALYDRHLDKKQQTISFVTVAELLQGAMLAKWGPANVAKLEEAIRTVTIIPYDLEVCRQWASLCGLKNKDGSPRTIETNDRWIAACALHHQLPLISHNRNHFEYLPGLELISEAPV
jgi:predicted nucleic acid-binding protein